MSELNFNGFFDALKKEKDLKESTQIIEDQKKEEDEWWNNYKNNNEHFIKNKKNYKK